MNSLLAKRSAGKRLWAILALSLTAFAGCVMQASAANPEQAPPIPPGQSRVWFARQLLPGSNFHSPMVYVNGAPIRRSDQGTVFYRDFVPGPYAFTVENCLPQKGTGQTITLQPNAQYALEVTQDDNGSWDCSPPQISYLRQVPPDQALWLLAPLTYMGPM
jgi:hypothetical protein